MMPPPAGSRSRSPQQPWSSPGRQCCSVSSAANSAPPHPHRTQERPASRVRTGNAPRAMATFRSHAIASLPIHGWQNIPSDLRWAARDYANAITLLGLAF